MREKLIQTAVNEENDETPGGDEGKKKSINPLAATLMKLKEAQNKDDDAFRA